MALTIKNIMGIYTLIETNVKSKLQKLNSVPLQEIHYNHPDIIQSFSSS